MTTTATTITRDELWNRLRQHDRLVVIEALPASYYHEGHVPGAINIPHDEVEELAPALIPDTSAEIVVYCASSTCQNSNLAARRLARLGYSYVREYNAGKADWIDAGLPVERGES